MFSEVTLQFFIFMSLKFLLSEITRLKGHPTQEVMRSLHIILRLMAGH